MYRFLWAVYLELDLDYLLQVFFEFQIQPLKDRRYTFSQRDVSYLMCNSWQSDDLRQGGTNGVPSIGTGPRLLDVARRPLQQRQQPTVMILLIYHRKSFTKHFKLLHTKRKGRPAQNHERQIYLPAGEQLEYVEYCDVSAALKKLIVAQFKRPNRGL